MCWAATAAATRKTRRPRHSRSPYLQVTEALESAEEGHRDSCEENICDCRAVSHVALAVLFGYALLNSVKDLSRDPLALSISSPAAIEHRGFSAQFDCKKQPAIDPVASPTYKLPSPAASIASPPPPAQQLDIIRLFTTHPSALAPCSALCRIHKKQTHNYLFLALQPPPV